MNTGLGIGWKGGNRWKPGTRMEGWDRVDTGTRDGRWVGTDGHRLGMDGWENGLRTRDGRRGRLDTRKGVERI